METFSFNRPIDLSQESKWLLAVTFFEARNSVFNITKENNSFSISTPGHWSDGAAETLNTLKCLLKLRYQNDTELHIKEVEKEVFL